MPTNIRLSGTVRDDDSKPMRKARAKLLYNLFLNGFTIYNGNGDQDVHLWNIQKKIKEADGFVFMPGATLDDIVKATSIFVGYQTGDMDLNNKPTVILNSHGTWTRWLELIERLNVLGTVSQKYSDVLRIVEKPKEVVPALRELIVEVEEVQTKYSTKPEPNIPGDTTRPEPEKNVCVFCSASSTNQEYIDLGYTLGTEIAQAGLGCVTGAGRTGIMGAVVKGAYENDGWTGGSNVPHIIEMEGLPDGLNAFWPSDDIYTRMQMMVEKSHAFVILPGGMGSVQETLVLLQLKEKGDPLMQDKPIYLINTPVEQGGFWNALITVAKQHKVHKHLTILDSPTGLIQKITST